MDIISEAIIFSTKAHDGQTRKYSSLPYIVHPIDVMNTLINVGFTNHKDLLAAAVLHDVVEDCDIPEENIRLTFSNSIKSLVHDVTKSPYTYSGNTRKEKWSFYIDYLKNCNALSKALKIADRYCNLKDYYHNWGFLDGDKKGFIKNIYTQEAKDLFSVCDNEEKSIPLDRLCKDLDDIIYLVGV